MNTIKIWTIITSIVFLVALGCGLLINEGLGMLIAIFGMLSTCQVIELLNKSKSAK